MAGGDLWSLVSPFVAAGTAVWLARRQDRERVSCFVDWSMDYHEECGHYDWVYVGIHNRSERKIAIRSVRFLSGGWPRRAVEGTALNYEDPFDLNFPYQVEVGQILTLPLDREAALKLAKGSGRAITLLNFLLRRPRLMVECVTTAGTRLRGSAEEVLPWDERQSWAKG